jgi:hypothetical protein
MFKKSIVSALTTVLFVGMLLAHGNATHLMGTVTAVGKDSVTIQDKDGKSVVVTLEKDTKYFKAKKPATTADMKVGTRVVIDAEMDQKTKKYSAEEINLGTAEAASPAAKPSAAPKK